MTGWTTTPDAFQAGFRSPALVEVDYPNPHWSVMKGNPPAGPQPPPFDHHTLPPPAQTVQPLSPPPPSAPSFPLAAPVLYHAPLSRRFVAKARRCPVGS